VGHEHPLEGAVDVSEELAQIGAAGEPGDVSGTEIEEPLRRLLRFLVVAELGVGIGQKA
jgi:hypothetical protein